MMAISRHDPEWTRTIATAYLAGVRFKQVSYRYIRPGDNIHWLATVPALSGLPVAPGDLIIPGASKIEVARKALKYLAGKGAPDVAYREIEPPELMEQKHGQS